MTLRPLTDRQIRFCQEFIKPGMDQAKALRAAGYAEQYINVGGRQILKNPAIAAKIEELRKPLEKQYNVSRSKQIERLEGIIEDSERDADKLKAIEIMNKMMGLNEPEKLQVTHVIRDDLETKLKKCTRLLVENGYKVIPPPPIITLPKEGKK
jgi:phage terminase small subunit